MSKILITGGAGFIGANFVHYLSKHRPDWKLVIFDALTYAGNLDYLDGAIDRRNVSFVKGNICNDDDLRCLFRDHHTFDYVAHFAAESHVDRSILDPTLFFNTNAVGTQKLLEVCHKYKVGKFLYVSTDEVYGSLGHEGVFTEQCPIKPSSPYSASKAAGEMACMAYYRTFNLPVIITRGSNTYGPFQFPEKLVPLFTTNALQDKKLPLYGDGSNVRDWLHVDDHCDGVLTVLEKGVIGEAYNVGGGYELASIDVTKLLLDLVNKPHDLINFVPDRPGHDFRYAMDCSKIEKELSWKPKITFEEGIKSTVYWYSNQHKI